MKETKVTVLCDLCGDVVSVTGQKAAIKNMRYDQYCYGGGAEIKIEDLCTKCTEVLKKAMDGCKK